MSDAGSNLFFYLGAGFVCAGIVILILATIMLIFKQSKEGKVKTAGVIVLGPIPIIFGNDKKDIKTLLVLSICLTVLLIAAAIVYYLLVWRA